MPNESVPLEPKKTDNARSREANRKPKRLQPQEKAKKEPARFTQKYPEEPEDEEIDHELVHKYYEQKQNIDKGEASKRIAVLNLDWESIDSSDILRISAPFVDEGAIVSVKIYSTPFGRRMQQEEESYGPILSAAQTDIQREKLPDSVESHHTDITQCDTNKDPESSIPEEEIRKYIKNRMKCYYAVIELKSKEEAVSLYEAIDGLEIDETLNFIDARFIPDDYIIKDIPKEEVEKPSKLKKKIPKNPLYHTKAELKWEKDAVRGKALRDLFTEKEVDLDLAEELVDVSDDSEKQEKYREVFKDIIEPVKMEVQKEVKTEKENISSGKGSKQRGERENRKTTRKTVEDEIVREETEDEDNSSDAAIIEEDPRFAKQKNNPEFAVDTSHPAYKLRKK